MRFKSLYCTYDRVAMLYGDSVFPAWNDDDAKRGFAQFLKSNSENIRPHDYQLVRLGVYDRVDGAIILDDLQGQKHVFICSGQDIVKEEKVQTNIADFNEIKTKKG